MAANRTQLQNALHKPYDRLLFSREVLSPVFGSGFSMFSSPIPATVLPNKSESAVIDQVGIYGKIRLDDSTEITCYEVSLQPNVRIEQSKVAIQQYVRKLLTAGQAALINFVSPSTKNVWRLTLVAKDSVLTESGVKEKTTNAKRYTFLLGPSETCRTAAERFEALSTEKEMTFQSLVNAFSVEKLSKAFFDEYTLHYQNFCDYLQESNYRKSVFNIAFPADASKEEKDKASKPIRDFVKKLLGRIVFLYFVQKKGWLGASDTDYTDGPGDFIRQLFDESGGNETFYCNWLTVLFFDTLNKQRTNDDFILPDGKRVKVPFLNGGLFDMEEFDDQFLTFPAALFHNPDFEDTILTEKNKVHARGFLDFLDAFNFTVYEDSPDDHTVAVDPEMLGHIFENLLEDNKDKGAFYTPKEIVHYMCQESLIEYLATGLQNDYIVYKELGNEQIELFGNEFRKGQLSLIEQLGEKGLDRDEVAYMVKQKDISKLTPKQLQSIDQLLDNVKICDPAIGSGAFPMGLLHEILSLKELIAYETGKAWNPAEVKLNIIQNSIYGVDIEKGAVDIARLRFWLSLVIDEEKPKPLPNLDYKIVVGDSLISKFDGEIVEIDWERKRSVGKADEYVKNVQRLLMEVAEKQKQYFNPNNKNKKQLQAEIRNLKIELLINQLSFNRLAYIEKTPQKGGFMPTAADIKFNTERELQIKNFDNLINNLKYLKDHPDEPFLHFDWKLDFPEVLNPYLVPDENRRGFDIVIGNPPYINIERIEESLKKILFTKYITCQGRTDIYIAFIEKSLSLIKNTGLINLIIPYAYTNQNYGTASRNLLVNNYYIQEILDTSNYYVFENATVKNIILRIQKNRNNRKTIIKIAKEPSDFELNSFKQKLISATDFLKLKNTRFETKNFNSTIDLKKKIDNKSLPLGKICLVAYGIRVNHKTDKSKPKNYYISDTIKSNFKPFVEGKDIDKYIFIQTKWLNYKPNEHYNPMFIELFENEKIMFINVVSERLRFAIDYNNTYNSHTVVNCVRIDKLVNSTHISAKRAIKENDIEIAKNYNLSYLCGILNSKLINWYFLNFLSEGLHFYPDDAKALPIKIASKERQNKIIIFVDQIITKKSQGMDTTDLEQQIDNLVFRLYELTYEEVKIIDPEFPLSKEEYENIQLEN